jgi:hypothetical protein
MHHVSSPDRGLLRATRRQASRAYATNHNARNHM